MTRIGKTINETYHIEYTMEQDGCGVAVGYQKFGDQVMWCTWEYIPKTEDDYFWGHYMIPTLKEAMMDAFDRIGWKYWYIDSE